MLIFIMLIASSNFTSKQMNILIGLVVAMFIITAAYVGYHASSQQPAEEIKGHNVAIDVETLGENYKPSQTLQKYDLPKLAI